MKVIYASCLCSIDKYMFLFQNCEKKPGQQVQKYHRLIVEGLVQNDIEIEVVSILPVTRGTSKKCFFKREREEYKKINYTYLPFINVSIIKNITAFINSFFYIFFAYFKNRDACLLGDVLNISVSAGALCAAKILKIPNIGIVTDLPALLYKSNSMFAKVSNLVIKSFGAYLFLTEDMNEIANRNNKPYLVLEGQVDINMSKFENNMKDKYEKKICIYAGGLQKIYGISNLVEAFLIANIDDAELHLYGSGDYEDELQSICKEHSAIKFYGVVPNEVIVSEETKATLLINPRPTTEEYTKYSFPSKNMEYMVSGTPVMTTTLPGMPHEYYPYVFLIKDESVEGISRTLRDILSMDPVVLHNKGLRAKDFVLNEKNNVIQSGKILELMKYINVL